MDTVSVHAPGLSLFRMSAKSARSCLYMALMCYIYNVF